MTKTILSALCALFAPAILLASGSQKPPVTGTAFTGVGLRVSNEATPANGLVQIKVSLTEAKPIIIGSPVGFLDAGFFGSVVGIAAFSPAGDTVGAALVGGGKVFINFLSPSGTFGTNIDYPLFTIAAKVLPTVHPGAKTSLNVNGSFSGLLGAYPVEIKNGQLTIENPGAVTITNVTPGSALVPAGQRVKIEGAGFAPNSVVACKRQKITSVQYVSPNEIEVTFLDPAVMHGQAVQITNPDGSQDLYYSYQRSVPTGVSSLKLMAQTYPVFAMNGYTNAAVPVPAMTPTQYAGLALQNQSAASVDVTVSLISGTSVLGTSVIKVDPNTKIVRGASEWIAVTAPAGSYYQVSAAPPVQVLGLLADDGNLTVQPILPVALP